MAPETQSDTLSVPVTLTAQAAARLGAHSPEACARRIRLTLAVDLHLQGWLPLSEAAALAETDEPELARAVEERRRALVSSAPSPRTPLPEGLKLSVLMPVFNERNTLLQILRRVLVVPIPKEVILVDDGSSDGTRELLREEVEGKLPDVRVFYHERNRGKGAALHTALAQVTGTVTVIQDADLEYNPERYPDLLRPILTGVADAVYGSRFLGGPRRVLYFWHAVGNRWLTTFSNVVTNLNLTDMETCYKVFRADLLKEIRIRSDRFGVEPELTAKIARRGARIYKTPITYCGRTYREGKKIGWKDRLQALWCILKYRFVE